MKIAKKLQINSGFISIIAVVSTSIVLSYLSFTMTKKTIENNAKMHMVSVLDIKKDQLVGKLKDMQIEIETLSEDLMIKNAMREFKDAFYIHAEEYKNNKSVSTSFEKKPIENYIEKFKQEFVNTNSTSDFDVSLLANNKVKDYFSLQYEYIYNNKYGFNNEQELVDTNDGTKYNDLHKKYHPHIVSYLKKFNLYDLMLVDDKTGDVIYSAFKDVDFTTSLKDGNFSKTGLGKIFRLANASIESDFSIFGDFEPYLPAFDQQIAFLATPIFDGEVKIGVLIFKIPNSLIDNIMTYHGEWENYGLGKTGETYLVGQDLTFRSSSRFFLENSNALIKHLDEIGVSRSTLRKMILKNTNIGLQKVDSVTSNLALDKKNGVLKIRDYRNNEVFSAYSYIEVPGLKWGILSEVDTDEVYIPLYSQTKEFLIYTLILIVALLLIALKTGAILANKISSPIQKFSELIKYIAKEKDLTLRIQVKSEDEISQMGDSVNNLISSFQNILKETLKSSEKVKTAASRIAKCSKSQNLNQQDELNETGEDLEFLSSKLEELSEQFKLFEEEKERRSHW